MKDDMTPTRYVREFIRINRLKKVLPDLDDYKARLLAAILHEERTASEPDWFKAARNVPYYRPDTPDD